MFTDLDIVDEPPYYVRFSDPAGGYVAEWYDNAADQGSATGILVTSDMPVTGIDAELARASGSIAGTARDSLGSPLENILAEVFPAAGGAALGSDSTAADGTYRVEGLPLSSACKVKFSDPGEAYRAQWYNAAAGADAAATVDVTGDITGVDAALTDPLPARFTDLLPIGPTVYRARADVDPFARYQVMEAADPSGAWSPVGAPFMPPAGATDMELEFTNDTERAVWRLMETAAP
jgi:hypothetical protein